MKESKDEEEYRHASILFIRAGDNFQFDSCRYEGLKSEYDFDDWLFLGRVAAEIGRLNGAINSLDTAPVARVKPGKAKLLPWIRKKVERLRELHFEEKLSEDQDLALMNIIAKEEAEWTLPEQEQLRGIYEDTKHLKLATSQAGTGRGRRKRK